MEKILSIIIPSYNTEKYINICLPYFLDQRIMDDIELLIISDGSKDRTVEIAKKYENKYPECIRVINKENGGHGSVINRGIKEAQGKYFKVVDGDDWVITDGLVRLVSYLKTHDVDMVVNPYIEYNDKTGSEKEIKRTYIDQYGNGEIYFFDNINLQQIVQMHEITYRTELLQQNNIKVDEGIFYVDAEYIIYPIPFVKKISFLTDPIYMYRVNSDTQSVNIKSAQKNLAHHEKVAQECLKFYEKEKEFLSPQKKKYVLSHTHRIVSTQYHILISFKPSLEKKSQIEKWDSFIKNNYSDVYQLKSDPLIELMKRSDFRLYKVSVELNLVRLTTKRIIGKLR